MDWVFVTCNTVSVTLNINLLCRKNVTLINLKQFYLHAFRDPVHVYEILMVTEIIQLRAHNELGSVVGYQVINIARNFPEFSRVLNGILLSGAELSL